MRTWNLRPGDPLSLTLAADARFSSVNYLDDQVWELEIGAGEPPVLSLHTTYGLRARNMRIFPRFIIGDTVCSNPADFAKPVTIHHFYPNYLRLSCAPFPGLDVELEYWVPVSSAVSGRIRIKNQTPENTLLNLEWAALLIPDSEGQPMNQTEIGFTQVLAGKTGNLVPVFLLTGSTQPGSGPFPCLALSLEIPPQKTYQSVWAQAASLDLQNSFELARRIVSSNWDAEIARLELSNAKQIEVHCGDADWDAAFALAQKVAMGLFVGPTPFLPAPSLVSTRLPDQGYSLRGDGSDYGPLWNGQTPLEAYYLAGLLLPAASDLVKGVLENFLATQAKDGTIDWKAGLGGQRSQKQATPLLACLAWRIYQFTEDRNFLEKVFPSLLAFHQSWFTPQHDRDGDGIPEWDHPLQTGFDDHPLFSPWHGLSQGVDITTVEAPDLCAYLYRESRALVEIARLVGREAAIPALETLADHLRTATEASWDEQAACYHYWDRDTHYSTSGEYLGERTGPGEILVERDLNVPTRLLIQIRPIGKGGRSVQVFIHGLGPSGEHRVERIAGDRFRWHLEIGRATSERTYTHIEHIALQDLEAEDEVLIHTVSHTLLDHTLLLPLWAGIPSAERGRFLIKNTLANPKHFWSAYGIRACAESPGTDAENPSWQSIFLPWNVLLAEGLLAYGQQAKAADLLSRIMKGVIQTLKKDGAFRRAYDAKTGYGWGEKNALIGLAPLGLFLEILGVRIINPRRVLLWGINPFPWPVTVKYQGLTIVRQKKRTLVIFPDGQNITVRNQKPQMVTLE